MRPFIITLSLALACTPRLSADMTADVKLAIERAVGGLKPLQRGDGSWGFYGVGSTSLVMLALMEANVPVNDPAILKAAIYVRHQGLRSQHTYSVALAILALDRLGVREDAALIRLLTERMINGQKEDGGWTYKIALGELGTLENSLPEPAGGAGSEVSIRNDVIVQEGGSSDNSNTQFAILSLWIGRRYDVPVFAPLRRAQARFRRTAVAQPAGLGWGYTDDDRTSVNGPRTCCGLLGLALNWGVEIERRLKPEDNGPGDGRQPPPTPVDPLKDAMVQEAFKCVTNLYVSGSSINPVDGSGKPDYYFLWSFERVAVAYGLTATFGIDWYKIGVRRLLPFQEPNGLWSGSYKYECDTSFALLFLCRSNLTRDLSTLLNPNKTPEMRADGTPPPAPPEPPPTVDSLVRKFLNAKEEARAKLVEEYRDNKGVIYTDAIAKLIGKATGDWPKALRDALAARLSRMTAATLRDRLKDTDTEMRRAAAVACAMKEDKALIPDLIMAIDDKEPWVVRACGVALSLLTGENFGPAANASAEERKKAIAAWREWWKKKGTTKQ